MPDDPCTVRAEVPSVEKVFDDDAVISRFLSAWYGPPDRPAAPPPEAERLPPPLRAWYGVTSGYARPLLFNHKINPAASVYEDDGMLGFCVDDFEWQEFGVPSGDEDPVVHRQLIDGDTGWEPHEEGMRLSQFLVAVLLHETVQGARYGAAADGLPRDRLGRLLEPLRPLPGPELFTAQYAGEGLLAIAWPASGAWSVRLAAREPQLLAYAAAVPGVGFGPGEWCPPGSGDGS
ncbi:hypothetical protein ACFFMN_27110 [Planobispora siamensis]|uniref:Uncharacterized protein n=1 Tax=Planobispora siamensis TaxID=936338 RepID=A0A8J3SCG9_9ACTN|nr:hypothetical protein [Planobispora siamensis]GIH90660.1 hypothetical protein Psi01_12900 [Planobispora siamensis]